MHSRIYTLCVLTTNNFIDFLDEQNNLRFNGTSMSYRIGEYNKFLFVAGNPATLSYQPLFNGFKLNNEYRVSIFYWNVADVQGGGEMSLKSMPMIQASPPQVQSIKSCLYMSA